MINLFDIPQADWDRQKKVSKLRAKIKARSLELGIATAHDNEGHWYVYQGRKYPSVTGRLSILKDQGLMNWKMNRALEYVQDYYNSSMELPEKIDEIIEKAKLVPQLEFEGAGDIGVDVHKWRQEVFNRVIDGKDWNFSLHSSLPSNEVISACRAIEKFVVDTGYIPLATELPLVDPKLNLGGQLDDIGLINDQLCLIDLKTSNIGNKDSFYAQVCLYLYMFRKLYRLYPKKVFILHVSKTNGFYELIPLSDRINIPQTINWAKKVTEVAAGLDILRQAKKVQPIKL